MRSLSWMQDHHIVQGFNLDYMHVGLSHGNAKRFWNSYLRKSQIVYNIQRLVSAYCSQPPML